MSIKPQPIHDVAIVGGGPAGILCAKLLIDAGASVILFDRQRSGFASVELLSGRARRILDGEFDLNLQDTLASIEIHETISDWTAISSRWGSITNPWGNSLSVIRPELDRHLRNQLNAKLNCSICDGKASAADFNDGLWSLKVLHGAEQREYKATFLVVASGNARKRIIDRVPGKSCAQYAVLAELGSRSDGTSRALTIGRADNNWYYLLPHPNDGHFAGLCVATENLATTNGTLSRDGFARWHYQLRQISEAHLGPVRINRISLREAGPRGHTTIAGPRWLAIGDAAFSSDPLSGTGIEFAVDSARAAVRSILNHNKEIEIDTYIDAVKNYELRHRSDSAIHYRG